MKQWVIVGVLAAAGAAQAQPGGLTGRVEDAFDLPRLARGAEGVDVERLQQWLNLRSRLEGGALILEDGDFGRGTEAAVRAVQEAEGLPVTGVADEATWEALRPEEANDPPLEGWEDQAPWLERGDQGGAVGVLQTLLNEARRLQGLAPLTVDGDFGSGTERAVRAFQRAAGVRETGAVHGDTWAALEAVAARTPLGSINPAARPLSEERYRRQSSDDMDVAIGWLPPMDMGDGLARRPLVFESKMAIDADGSGGAWRTDPWGQPETSLRYADGTSLNPTRTNFFVLPLDIRERHPAVRLGDVAAVIYRGRVAYAILGDMGPRTKLGEGSIALAEALGIPADPRTGGVSGGVTYVVFPGSGERPPLSGAEVDRLGAELLRRAGGAPGRAR